MGFFEGYYIKCHGEKDTIAIIFGYNRDKKKTGVFIQIITCENSYCEHFDISHFSKTKKGLDWKVGTNRLNTAGLVLDINTADLKAIGEVTFGELAPLQSRAMGPFEFFPFMECKHTVVSMQHKINGQVTINDKVYNLNDGLGYIEGDRGKSFPKKYFWSHAHLDKNISVSASCAIIPYLGMRFIGTICFIYHGGLEYRLATYNHAKVRKFSPAGLHIIQGRGKKRLELTIEVLDTDNSRPLLAPTRGKMNRTIEESIKRKVRYMFVHGSQTVFDITTNRAAVEFSEII